MNRPGFTRHFLAYKFRATRGCQGISGVIKQHGTYEPNIGLLSAALINVASEGNLILDIGANLGSYWIPLAQKFPQKRFVAFEPQRTIYYQLCGNVFLNGTNNIAALNFALGAKNSVIETALPGYENDHNIGAFSLRGDIHAKLRGSPNQGTTESIEIKRLDSLDYHDIVLIKIDVEGAELDVLQGGIGTIVRNNYPPLIYEAWDFDWYAEQKNKLEKFLTGLGYEILKFDQSFNYLAQHPKRGNLLRFAG